MLCACSESKPQPYLSISYSTYEQASPIAIESTRVIISDIPRDATRTIAEMPYVSQSGSIYSRHDNLIYYSAPSEITGRCYELFSYNPESGVKTQLTNGLAIISHIIPRQDDILLVAVKAYTHSLRLVRDDKTSGLTTYHDIADDDSEVWTLGLNVNNESEYYTAVYAQSQEIVSSEKQATNRNNRYYCPDHTLYRYTGAWTSEETIQTFPAQKNRSDQRIGSISAIASGF